MTSKVDYLTTILEKIGAPLVGAAMRGDSANEAQNIAILLSRSVQLSIEIGKLIEIEKANPDSVEALRVTLAALASPIVADSFKSSGTAPTEGDLMKITTALQSIMTFSDNFMPSEEQAIRMDKIAAQGEVVDSFQANIQYIQALSPVIDAVASFSFGIPEKKMVLDISNRLVAQTGALRKSGFPNATENDTKRIELAFMRCLGEIYAQCHKNEVAKISAMDDPSAQNNPVEEIWTEFDKRAAMIGVLADNLLPGGVKLQNTPAVSTPPPPPIVPTTAATAPATQAQLMQSAAPASEPAPVKPQIFGSTQTSTHTQEQPAAAPPPTAAPVTSPPPATPTVQQQPAGGYNPMSMFSPAKAEEQQAPASPAAPPPPAAPVAQTPPPASPFAATPLATPSVEPPEEGEQGEGGEQSGSGSGNPMSFFKKGE